MMLMALCSGTEIVCGMVFCISLISPGSAALLETCAGVSPDVVSWFSSVWRLSLAVVYRVTAALALFNILCCCGVRLASAS